MGPRPDRDDIRAIWDANAPAWIELSRAGFALTAIGEPRADEATARAHPEVADTRIVPYFLIVQARRT